MHTNDDADDDDRLTSLIPTLREEGYDTGDLSYRVVRERAQGAAIRAYQGADHIWRFKQRDISAIAAALKLKKRPVPTTDRTASRPSIAAA